MAERPDPFEQYLAQKGYAIFARSRFPIGTTRPPRIPRRRESMGSHSSLEASRTLICLRRMKSSQVQMSASQNTCWAG